MGGTHNNRAGKVGAEEEMDGSPPLHVKRHGFYREGEGKSLKALKRKTMSSFNLERSLRLCG